MLTYAPQPFQAELLQRRPGILDEPSPFVVVVNTTLYPLIQTYVNQYLDDLEGQGYAPILYTTSGGTAAALKSSILVTEWEAGAVGALLVGDLPVPWFECYEDWDDNGIPDEPVMADFPCDLFYMDLDGTWADGDGDGIYDVHEGSWQPDFWIGRLTASTLQGDEASMVQGYFSRNHAYQISNLSLPHSALAYVDDDWEPWAAEWGGAVAQVWPATTIVSEINTTTASDYMARWDDNYQNILVCVHSAAYYHTFRQNNGSSWGNVYWNQISAADPHFLFYNLFACSNSNFLEDNYCGGYYIFNDTYGINAIGSTKTGSMLFFEDYYGPLSFGQTFGEAFNSWFALHGNEPGSQMWARGWFYGMTYLGDPTLSVRPAVSVELTPQNPPIQIAAAGGTFNYAITMANASSITQTPDIWLTATLPSGTAYPILGPVVRILTAGSSLSRQMSQSVPAGAPAGTYVFNAYVGDYPSVIWHIDSFEFEKLPGRSPSSGEGSLTVTALPQNLQLAVFPNPFNPQTAISFQLSADGYVSLRAYDTTGRLIQILADGWLEVGTHEVNFDGSNLAAGVYLIRLQTDQFVQTRKMMLVK
jgi:hypothetical protein